MTATQDLTVPGTTSDNDESLTPPHIEQDNNEDDRPRPDRYTGILCTYFAGEGIIILSGNLMLY